jgi:hypothetical protein
MMDQNTPEVNEDLGSGGKFKNWLQDNIRIIISVLIVVVIAVGIYSYSKRGETPATSEEVAVEQPESVAVVEKETTAVTVIGDDKKEAEEKAEKVKEKAEKVKEEARKAAEGVKEKAKETGEKVEEKVASIDEGTKEEVKQKAGEAKDKVDQVIEEAKQKVEEKKEVKVDDQASSQSISEETGEAFVETAVAGDSLTTLSRKALKNYLEKNQDSSLTPEHKIYIEDYLRRNVGFTGQVNVGTQVSFSKNLIKDAIEKSKTLNENQLNNLNKYAAQVPGL